MKKAFVTEKAAVCVYGDSGTLTAFLNLQPATQMCMDIQMKWLGSEVQSSSLLKENPIKMGFGQLKVAQTKFQK